MDAATSNEASTSVDALTAAEVELELNSVDSLEVVSSRGEVNHDIERAGQGLTRLELDLAWSCEKLLNLNVLVMHVATRESDFEAFVLDKEPTFGDSAHKAQEFDFLSGILDSEVKQIDNFLSTLQTEILSTRDTIVSCESLGDASKIMEAKLDDCEESLNQSLEQLSEIKVQCSNFERIIRTSGKHDEEVEQFENGYLSNLDTKIKMQTGEQQRHILRMLEKSLARELDLEKKLTESRQNEELLNLRLQEEIYFMEEEAEAVWERLFKAENLAEVLLSSSKDLLGRLQIVQFSVNGSTKREEIMRSKLQDYSAQLEAKDCSLRDHERTIVEFREEILLLQEKQNETVLELQNVKDTVKGNDDLYLKIAEMENLNSHLEEKSAEAEKRAETAESSCKMLREANKKLEEELNHLKSDCSASDRIEQLETQLSEADIRLQHAVASAEASLEKQGMLNSTIKDMETLIDDLKSKVLKAESQTESVEEKCIILSESNADLSEELNFLRGRIECLEASLHQAEETKRATAKDINMRTKLISDFLVQLTFERERLHKQIHSLMKDKMVMANFLQKIKKNNIVAASNAHKEPTTESMLSKHDISDAVSSKESEDGVTDFSAVSSERHNISENGNVRNIDAWQLNCKYVLFPVFVLLISAAAAFWLQHQTSQS